MDVEVVESGAWTQKVTVTLPSGALNDEVNTQLKGYQRKHKQRGFRTGKVPMGIIKARYGKAARAEAADKLIQQSMPKALDGLEDIIHVTPIDVLGGVEDEKALSYSFDAERKPAFEPANYVGVEVEKTVVKVPDEAVDAAVEELRQGQAFNQAVDRDVVEAGDVVKFTLESENEEASGHEHEVEVVEGGLVEGLYEGLSGAKIDEPVKVTIKVGGEDQEVEITVVGIFKKVLPEIDDDLAVEDGRAPTLLELRLKLREELQAEFTEKADEELKGKVADKLVEFNPFELPKHFLEARLNDELRNRLMPFLRSGISLDQLGIDPASFKENIRPSFVKALHHAFVLDAIAEKENIEVTDAEVDAHIDETYQDGRQRQQARAGEERANIHHNMRLDKAFEMVIAKANITEVEREPSHFDEAPEHSHDHDHDGGAHDHSHVHDENCGHDHDHSHGHDDDTDHNHDHSHDHDHGHDHGDSPVEGEEPEVAPEDAAQNKED